MRIPGLKEYRGRNPRGYFQDLTWEEQQRAHDWLHFFTQRAKRERGSVPPWLRAIYVGQAGRLARTSPDERSAWGHRMLAKRGGLAVQKSYRDGGRVGKLHPAHKAARVSASNRRLRKKAKERGPLTESERHSFGNLQGI